MDSNSFQLSSFWPFTLALQPPSTFTEHFNSASARIRMKKKEEEWNRYHEFLMVKHPSTGKRLYEYVFVAFEVHCWHFFLLYFGWAIIRFRKALLYGNII